MAFAMGSFCVAVAEVAMIWAGLDPFVTMAAAALCVVVLHHSVD